MKWIYPTAEILNDEMDISYSEIYDTTEEEMNRVQSLRVKVESIKKIQTGRYPETKYLET